MDISPSHPNYTNNLKEEIKEEGDFDVVNMDISPSHTICIKNMHEEIKEEDCQTNQLEKKKKRRKRGGQRKHARKNRKRDGGKRGGRKVSWRKKMERAMDVALSKCSGNKNTESKPGFTPVRLATDHMAEHTADIDRQWLIDTSYDDSKPEGMDGATATTSSEYGGNETAESKPGFTSLFLAAQEGPTEHSAGNPNGLTPLHVCAQEDQVSVAAVLVKKGASVNAVSKAGYTPLHVACYYGNMDMVQFLLENGASVNAGTAGGTAAGWQAALQMPPGGEE